jgi:hypothetical protein
MLLLQVFLGYCYVGGPVLLPGSFFPTGVSFLMHTGEVPRTSLLMPAVLYRDTQRYITEWLAAIARQIFIKMMKLHYHLQFLIKKVH